MDTTPTTPTPPDIDRYRYLAERRRRQRIAAVIVPGVLGILIIISLISVPDFLYYTFGLRGSLAFLLAILLFATSGAAVLMIYLQTGFKKDLTTESFAIKETEF